MDSETLENIQPFLICFSCLVGISAIIWLALRWASGEKQVLPTSNFKELINIDQGTKSGVIGGVIGGVIYSSTFAFQVFPTETVSLQNALVIWIIFGIILGLAGGGIGGFISHKLYGPRRRDKQLLEWIILGALAGPLFLATGSAIGIGGLTAGINLGGSSPLFVVLPGAILGAILGGAIQNRN